MAEVITKEQLLKQAKEALDAGRYDKAAQLYEKVLERSPNALRVRLRLGELYVRLKEREKAITAFLEVAESYTDDEFYLKAVDVYKQVLRLQPAMLEVNRKLADIYEAMGSLADAIHQHHIVIRTLQQHGAHAEVLALRKKIVKLDPDNVTGRIRLAEAYMVGGDEEASTKEYEKLATKLQDSGSEDQLVDLYEKILSRKPETLDLLLSLCRIYYARRDFPKFLKWMERSQATASTNAELLRMHAQVLASQNQVESSRGKWRDLAQLYVEAGESEQAIRAYEEAFVVSADDVDDWKDEVEAVRSGAFDEIVESAGIRREQQLAAEEAQEALEHAQAEAADQLNEAQAEAADTTDTPAPAVSVQPLSPEEHEALQRRAESGQQLAEVYEEMGLTDEALEELGKSQECYRRLLATGNADHSILSASQHVDATISRLRGE